MKKFIVILISILLLVIDNSILPDYAIYGGFPSLLFVFAIAYALINGKNDAVFIGVVSGILQDVYFIKGFGINSLINLILCLVAAIIGENILKKNKIIPVISALLLSLIKVLLVAGLLRAFNESISIEPALLSAVYNSIIMIFVYNVILTTCNKYMDKDKWRFKW